MRTVFHHWCWAVDIDQMIQHLKLDSLKQLSLINRFLAVQNNSIGDLVTDLLTEWLLILTLQRLVTFETFDQSDEVTWSDHKTDLPTTYLPANLPTSLREHPQGAILDTCDNWDIWSAVMIWHLGCSLMEQS